MKKQHLKILSVVVLMLALSFCGSDSVNTEPEFREGTINTKWRYPSNAKLRVSSRYEKKFFTYTIPCEISFFVSENNFTYFVEILTVEKNRIYGVLETLNTSELTDLTKINIEITAAIVERILNNELSTISIVDPANQKKILSLSLGNRMSPEMTSVYEDKKVEPY